ERSELQELHYITPIDNVPSISQHGILSNVRAARLAHASVAMAEIQDRRSRVVVPGGRKLHEYVYMPPKSHAIQAPRSARSTLRSGRSPRDPRFARGCDYGWQRKRRLRALRTGARRFGNRQPRTDFRRILD